MSLKAKVEQALAAVLDAADLSADVFLGFDSDEQTRPCVACVAEQGDEHPGDSGNYWFQCRVTVKSNADRQDAEDPAADHAARVAEVDAALNIAELPAELSDAVEDFHCLGVRGRKWAADPQGRSFTDTYLFEGSFANRDLS